MDSLLTLNPLVIWGLFSRGFGLVFLVSFLSLALQIREAAGSTSVLPVKNRLAKISEDFPSWRRFTYFPTLLWLSASDAMLLGLTSAGLAGSVAVLYGGPFGFWGLLVCYVSYLSLDIAIGLIFPWDAFLFEATVLGLFLPATSPLPELEALSTPAPALAWAYRLLLFRLMFGFGKQKFIGSRRKDLAYLKGFLVSQPLPSAAGWYVQKLPSFLLKGAVLFMFFVEVPAPFFAFFPGPLSIVFAACTAFLMVGIQTMGSFGYFSIATIVMCLPLLDNVTPKALFIGSLFDEGQPLLTNAYVVVHTLAACLVFPFNSWTAQSYHLWAFWYQLPKAVQPVLHFLRVMHPFRWLHPYGVFPPNNWPAAKMSLLFEVTWDDQAWYELKFQYSPSNAKSFPKFVAPHHPRGDQAVIYETLGLNPNSLVAGLMGPWDPYPFGSRSPVTAICQRMLEGDSVKLFELAGAPNQEGPPKSVRISTIMLEPVGLAEHRATGDWWKRTYVGPHMPPLKHDPNFFTYFLAEPELWHFDFIFWRRRSRLAPLMKRAQERAMNPMDLALVDAKGITPEDVEAFWNEFVPLVGSPRRDSFDTLPETVAEVRKKFDLRRQRAFYRLLGRFSLFLVVRLEPLYLHRGMKPLIPVKTYFHLWMLASHIVGSGRAAYLAALADPPSVVRYVPELTVPTGLYAHSVFRLEEMTFEAQKLRLINEYVFPYDPVAKAQLERKIRTNDWAALKPGERLFVRLAQAVSGFFNVMPDVRDCFKGPKFDHGYPEHYPTFQELESGEVVVKSYHPDAEASRLGQGPVQRGPSAR